VFEDIVDTYPTKQKERKVSFRLDRVSQILGLEVLAGQAQDVLKRYNIEYTENGGEFEINVPPMRLDLEIEEDMAEEIGRVLGYDKVKPQIPEINFEPKVNDTYAKISWARNKLLGDGYHEVMNTSFSHKGEVEVEKSASDKNFLRTNLTDGLLDSVGLNSSMLPLLGIKNFKELKVFEIGTVFTREKERINVAYNIEEQIEETTLEDFCKNMPKDFLLEPRAYSLVPVFNMWSLFPFIARDIAVWVPDDIDSQKVAKIIKDNAGELLIRGPELFDEFKKDKQISYAFKLVFQSFDRTLTDTEINEIMTKISNKIQAQKTNGSTWQVR
jgi:phenylalanyl-tRNA synthetase beta subunit